jgi:hypothetical protein
MLARADARQHQDLRCIEHARRQDDLTPCCDRAVPVAITDFDSRGTAVLDHDARDVRAGDDREVVARAPRRSGIVGDGGPHAFDKHRLVPVCIPKKSCPRTAIGPI